MIQQNIYYEFTVTEFAFRFPEYIYILRPVAFRDPDYRVRVMPTPERTLVEVGHISDFWTIK